MSVESTSTSTAQPAAPRTADELADQIIAQAGPLIAANLASLTRLGTPSTFRLDGLSLNTEDRVSYFEDPVKLRGFYERLQEPGKEPGLNLSVEWDNSNGKCQPLLVVSFKGNHAPLQAKPYPGGLPKPENRRLVTNNITVGPPAIAHGATKTG